MTARQETERSRYITDDHSHDDVDRRGFLKCMAWAGTGLAWTLERGIPVSTALGELAACNDARNVFFAQISDSHIGFNKEANKDVTATLQRAVAKLNALPASPAFVLHTGDITQLSTPPQFDTAQQILSSLKTDRVFYVPGEHDVIGDNGAGYLARYGKDTRGNGWYSFDHSGVHFIGLVNVLDLKAGGFGSLGAAQLDWLKKDVNGLSASTPIVLFAHVPLWTVYPAWGWGTDDAAQALALLKRFGSVTVLNGHIHQIMQKVEGQVSFHTAMSTAFPQPAPGNGPAPGPMTVDPGQLASVLGVAEVTFVKGQGTLAIVDSTLSGAAPAFAAVNAAPHSVASTQPTRALGAGDVEIHNFTFTPKELTVPAGTTVTWVNDDDVPHVVASVQGKFASSQALDTHARYSYRFAAAGTYDYFCSIHPYMTGRVVVHS